MSFEAKVFQGLIVASDSYRPDELSFAFWSESTTLAVNEVCELRTHIDAWLAEQEAKP